MDWEYVLAEVITILARAIIVACVPYIVKLAKDKIHDDRINKYVDKAGDVVIQCVDYVNQTYVDALKKEGKFDKGAQEAAFYDCKQYVLNMLNDSAKEAVIEVFGDLDFWIESMIEFAVRNSVNHNTAIPIEEGVVIEDED